MDNEELLIHLRNRWQTLQHIAENKRRSLKNSPEGFLRGERQRNTWRYYYRLTKQDRHGTYIPKSKIDLAYKLAQKRYDKMVLESAEKEIRLLKELGELCNNQCIEHIFNYAPASYQPLIRTLADDQQLAINHWKSQTYTNRPFDERKTPLYANDGTRVRSKSEMLIANLLIFKSFPYLYEKPLKLNNNFTVHPDFTIYDVRRETEIYWEHLGMLDNADYLETAVKKVRDYENSGFFLGDRLIITTETEEDLIDIQLAERVLDNVFRPR